MSYTRKIFKKQTCVGNGRADKYILDGLRNNMLYRELEQFWDSLIVTGEIKYTNTKSPAAPDSNLDYDIHWSHWLLFIFHQPSPITLYSQAALSWDRHLWSYYSMCCFCSVLVKNSLICRMGGKFKLLSSLGDKLPESRETCCWPQTSNNSCSLLNHSVRWASKQSAPSRL